MLADLYLRYRRQPLPAAPAGRPAKGGACALMLLAGLRLARRP